MKYYTTHLLSLLFLTFLLTIHATLTVNPTALTFPPGVTGAFLDVYADESKDVFIIFTEEALFQLDYNRTVIKASVDGRFGHSGFPRIDSTLAGSDNFIYIPAGNFTVMRFTVTNITDNAEFFFHPFLGSIDPANDASYFVMTFHPTLKYGVITHYGSIYALFFDATTMTLITRLNYTQGDFVFFDRKNPGGSAPAIDTWRNLLYISVICSKPNPAVVWQYDITDIFNPVLLNYKVWGSYPCFEEGFVDTKDGRYWVWEDQAGWVGAFDTTDLSYGSQYYVPTNDFLGSFDFDLTTHTAYYLDSGSGSYVGNLYRVCTLEKAPASLRERVPWHPAGVAVGLCGSFYEASKSIVYVVPCSTEVFTVSVSSNCPTWVPASSASSLSSFLSFLF